jgi:hypothetical protein
MLHENAQDLARRFFLRCHVIDPNITAERSGG